jgi:hypothetical protein
MKRGKQFVLREHAKDGLNRLRPYVAMKTGNVGRATTSVANGKSWRIERCTM